jgi:adenine-specific DNA-methyltransferase
MDTEQKITSNIKVPNNNTEILKKHFGHCFDKNGNFDIEKFKQELSENEIDFYKESYGLDWLGKSYARILASDEATTLLKEDEAHNQKPENNDSQNLLIKGDNLEVLKHLSNAYAEKIKMIYIDPPYNTGDDFVYQDDRNYSVAELKHLAGIDEDKAKRILDFTQSKSNSHSAWLTFMYPRLYIAKQLLKEDGVIFISIDDNEVAQLRLLMDEVFGEEHFVADIIWEKRYGRSNDAKLMASTIDHILLYRKSENLQLLREVRTESANKAYSNPDNDPRGLWTSVSFVSQRTKEERPNLSYKIVNPHTNKEFKHPIYSWKYAEDKYSEWLKDNRFYWGKDGKQDFPRIKRFLNELDDGLVPVNLWKHQESGTGDEGTKEVNKLIGNAVFTYPKPTKLLKRAIGLGFELDAKNGIILDFFAGSGTTGDAVMQLNAEDGGNRKFILVQLPEPIDKKKNKTAYDFVKDEFGVAEPTIFEITKERLIRASKKINTELDEKTKDLELKIKNLGGELPTEENKLEIENLQAQITQNSELKTQNNFKIFETTPIWDDYLFEADELDTQTKLFDENTLTDEDVKALLTTWKTYDGSALTEKLNETDLGGYKACYVSERLYLMHKGFTTNNLKSLLEKIDTDKQFNPTSIIAFGYHFESKSLREISENIKSYANKKNIDIDFITRY